MQQFVARKLSSSLAHGHHNSIDVLALDDRIKIGSHANHSRIQQALADKLWFDIDKADDTVTRVGSIKNLARYFDRIRARTHNQDAFSDLRVAQEPVDRNSPSNHQTQCQRQSTQPNTPSQH